MEHSQVITRGRQYKHDIMGFKKNVTDFLSFIMRYFFKPFLARRELDLEK